MAIKSIEDGKTMQKYCESLGRKGVAEKIIKIAKEIVEQKGAYQTTLINAGKIRMLAIGCKFDLYWDEKQGIGGQKMVSEADDSLQRN